MARSKEEIAAIIVDKKLARTLRSTVPGDLVSLIARMSNDEKANMVRALVTRNYEETGNILYKALVAHKKDVVVAEVDTMLANNKVTIEDLDSFLDG